MKAKEIMSKPVLATTPRASLRDIATQLVVNSISGMPVADRKGTVLGIVTEADVLEAVKDGQQLEKLTATEVMSKSPVTVDVEVSIEEVIKLLVEGGFRSGARHREWKTGRDYLSRGRHQVHPRTRIHDFWCLSLAVLKRIRRYAGLRALGAIKRLGPLFLGMSG